MKANKSFTHNGKDFPHLSHQMERPAVSEDGRPLYTNKCSACKAKMWGHAGDWNNDTALELPCKAKGG